MKIVKFAAIVASILFLAAVGSCALLLLGGAIQTCHGP